MQHYTSQCVVNQFISNSTFGRSIGSRDLRAPRKLATGSLSSPETCKKSNLGATPRKSPPKLKLGEDLSKERGTGKYEGSDWFSLPSGGAYLQISLVRRINVSLSPLHMPMHLVARVPDLYLVPEEPNVSAAGPNMHVVRVSDMHMARTPDVLELGVPNMHVAQSPKVLPVIRALCSYRPMQRIRSSISVWSTSISIVFMVSEHRFT